MIKIIENALRNLSDMQLNLESDVARTWIAEKVATAIKEQQKDLFFLSAVWLPGHVLPQPF